MAPPKPLTVSTLTATENVISAGGVQAGGFTNMVDADSGISWLAGTVDPRGQFEPGCGSLYTRRVGAYPGTAGELWLKNAPGPDGWTRIA